MKRLLFIAFASASFLLGADEALTPEAIRYRKTGGTVVLKGTGTINVVNGQDRLPDSVFHNVASAVVSAINVDVDVQKGAFSMREAMSSKKPTIYVVEDPSLPMSLIAPEAAFGVANVAGLEDALAEKEILRVVWMTSGGIVPRTESNPLGRVSNPADLKRVNPKTPDMDELINVMHSLQAFGITPTKTITYKKACRMGIAEPPTNDVQKAIWDQVHELPSQPIKIEFDKEKGR